MKGMQLGGLLGFFDPDHPSYESHTSIANFSSNLPAALRREDQPSGLKARIAVTVWNVRTQRRRRRIESSAVYFKFASESFPSPPRKLVSNLLQANKSNIARIRVRINRSWPIRRPLNFTSASPSI